MKKISSMLKSSYNYKYLIHSGRRNNLWRRTYKASTKPWAISLKGQVEGSQMEEVSRRIQLEIQQCKYF
jgi:hypothetical protein